MKKLIVLSLAVILGASFAHAITKTPASNVSVVTSAFANCLSSEDTDVQISLNDIDHCLGSSNPTFADSLINTSNTVTLVNDSSSPGNTKYYGTNGSGTKGFYTLSGGSPGGSQYDVQTNNGSSGFAGDSGFTYEPGVNEAGGTIQMSDSTTALGGVLTLNNNDTSNYYESVFNAFAPNITNGEVAQFRVGKSGASNDAAEFDFTYGTTDSTFYFGMYGNTAAFKFDNAGDVYIPLLSSNGLIKTTGGTGALSIATAGTDYLTSSIFSSANTWSAAQTFDASDIKMYNPAGTYTYTITPAAITGTKILNLPNISSVSDTLATLGLAQTWGALQTFGNDISIGGKQFNIGTLSSGQAITYNGTNWVNTSLTSGSAGNVQLGNGSGGFESSSYFTSDNLGNVSMFGGLTVDSGDDATGTYAFNVVDSSRENNAFTVNTNDQVVVGYTGSDNWLTNYDNFYYSSDGVSISSANDFNLFNGVDMYINMNSIDSGGILDFNDEDNPFFEYLTNGSIEGGDIYGDFDGGMFYMNTYSPVSTDYADFGVYDAFGGMVFYATGSGTNFLLPVNDYAPINGIVTPGGNLVSGSSGTFTNWTGSFGAGYTHTTGNTSVLTFTIGTWTVGAKYRLSFTISGRTSSSVTVAVGGITVGSLENVNEAYIYNLSPTSTTALTFTPQTGFDGTISNISLNQILPQFVATDTSSAQPGGAIDSGYISLIGQGYNTTAVASQPVEWRILVQPSVATSLGGSLVMQDNLNNAGANNLFTFGNNGSLTASSFSSGSYNGGTGLTLSNTAGGTTTGNLIKLAASNTRTNTTGSTAIVNIAATYDQASGTTPNTDLLISRTETAVGSGAQLFVDMQVAGLSKFSIDDTGNPIVNGTAAVSCAAGTISVLTEVVTNGIVTHC